MKPLTILIIINILIILPFTRMLIFNSFKIPFHIILDIFRYIRFKKWQDWKYYGIYDFCGYFGKGKTLSATALTIKIVNKYKKYGKKVRVISNYDLKFIDYIPLENFQQIVELGKMACNGQDTEYAGTIVLIDEIEFLLSHRNYAKFPLEMLATISQQRKAHITFFATLQKFHMCDKAWRDLSLYAVDCKKYWRFEKLTYYDATDVENATDTRLIQPKKINWFYITDSIYKAYDTSKMISQASASDFLSNEEVLQRRCVESVRNDDIIKHKKKIKGRKKSIGIVK